ncbi:MAG TPA: DUF1206 domain-containing protein [Lacunisphaera sp.]|nr:DUF1206 domain-containing protein [Lacunisphaera sp.]
MGEPRVPLAVSDGTMSPPSQKTVRKVRPWLLGIARVGFAAKGTIYLLIGGLALAFAVGFTRQPEDTRGAIEVVSQQPFGAVALLVLALGLVSYGLWNAVQCVWDPEHVGRDWLGQALRGIFGLSAAVNAFLAYQTAGLAVGRAWSGEDGDAAVQSWTSRALAWPGGRVLVLIAAAIMAGIALSLVVRLVRGKYIHQFAEKELAKTGSRVVKTCAWFGFLGQAVVAILIAWFLWRAGLHESPEEAGGFSKALVTLLEQPFGRTLLGFTAFGVLMQGVYIWLMVPYREIHVRQVPEGVRDRWGRAWGW